MLSLGPIAQLVSSIRLIIGRSQVRVLVGPPNKEEDMKIGQQVKFDTFTKKNQKGVLVEIFDDGSYAVEYLRNKVAYVIRVKELKCM